MSLLEVYFQIPSFGLQSSLKQYEKQLSLVLKERDQVRTDLAKLVLSRSRLESLCRELQRQNKEIKVTVR